MRHECKCAEHLCERVRNLITSSVALREAYQESDFADSKIDKIAELTEIDQDRLLNIVGVCERLHDGVD